MSFKPKERRRDFGRDARERKKERLDAAFDLARKIQADEIERLRQAGFKGEKLREKTPRLNEIADSLLANHSDAIDGIIERRKQQLEEARKRGWLTEFSDKRIDRIAAGFEKLLEEKKAREKGEEPKSGGVRPEPRHVKKKLDGLEKEIHRLYYEKGMTQRQIAKRFGVGEATMSRLFTREGWLARVDRRGIKMRVFDNEKERKDARREHRRITQRRIRELRAAIFDTKCEICGIDTKKEKRTLAIHRKDGTEHERNVLWRMQFLSSLKKEEWAPLCIPCHRGTHWLMKWANKDWDHIASQRELSTKLSKETLKPLTRDDYEKPRITEARNHLGESVKEVRKSLFGDSCHFCGEIEDGKRMAIHRKDGRPHESRILASAKYLKKIDPDEWVALCSKCHRQVTWARNTLGMKWEDICPEE